MQRRGRVRAQAVAIVALAVTLWPLVRNPPSDGFPLSNYPMFLQVRPDVTSIDVALGLDANGDERRLSPSLVGGSNEVIQAVAALADAIGQGQEEELCEAIAGRVAAGGKDIEIVLIVSETYEIVDALANDAPPVTRTVHVSCEVPEQ